MPKNACEYVEPKSAESNAQKCNEMHPRNAIECKVNAQTENACKMCPLHFSALDVNANYALQCVKKPQCISPRMCEKSQKMNENVKK